MINEYSSIYLKKKLQMRQIIIHPFLQSNSIAAVDMVVVSSRHGFVFCRDNNPIILYFFIESYCLDVSPVFFNF